MKVSDEFRLAGERYIAMVEAGTSRTAQGAKAFAAMLEVAPDEFKQKLAAEARALGLLPEKPKGYLVDGTPVYAADDVAKSLGCSKAELDAMASEAGFPSIDSLGVYRAQ